MKALCFDGKLKIKDIKPPDVEEGEVLIKILYSAICNTDIELTRGYMNFSGVPGHEFVGKVISESSGLYGKKVVGEINCSCGSCPMCLKNRKTHCFKRTVLGIYKRQGVFAEYIALPEKNLFVIDESSDTDCLNYVFTEPLAAAYQIFNQTHLKSTDKIFIFGTGKLGVLIACLCELFGLNYKAFNRNDFKIGVCKKLGLNCGNISELGSAEFADVCIESTGNKEGLELCLSHLYPGGKLVLKSTIADNHKIDFNKIVVNEIKLIGSRCGEFFPALNIISQNSIDFKPLITKIYNFENIVEAFDYAAENKNSFKIIIKH